MKPLNNKYKLAPLTNQQSHEDGSLSEDEYHWLVKRAEGGFGIVMTCASHVQEAGKGFPGQLGIFSDQINTGLRRLSSAIKQYGLSSATSYRYAFAYGTYRHISTLPF